MNRSIAISLCFAGLALASEAAPAETTPLPVVHIGTSGRKLSDSGIVVRFGVTDNGSTNAFDAPWNGYDGYAEVNFHGTSSSWNEKTSYSVGLTDAAGKETRAGLLGMPEESDWVLVANFSDKSLVRNAFGYAMSAATGHYAPRTRMVELVIDAEYEGTYLLVERVRRDSLRVDVSKLDADDNQGDSLTGGYILRVDRSSDGTGWTSERDDHVYFQHYYPKASRITPQQTRYIRDWIRRFENMMSGADFADTAKGYPKWIAQGSFRDHLLINELVRNNDGYRLSSFLHKDKDSKGGKLHAGPVWDMDLSCGLPDYYDGWKPTGWVYEWDARSNDDGNAIPFWWKKLADEPSFRKQLGCRWQELRQGAWSDNSWHHLLDSLATRAGSVQARNFRRWDIMDKAVWPVAYVPGTYQGEIDTLKSWLRARISWMDSRFAGKCDIGTGTGGAKRPVRSAFELHGNRLVRNAPVDAARLTDPAGSVVPLATEGTFTDLERLPRGLWTLSWRETADRNWHSRALLLPSRDGR